MMVVLLIPSFAFAAGNSDGTATLTIIHGVDSWSGPVVVVNVKYEFENGATLKDLFEAAKQAGDLGDYHFSYGYIDSITTAGGIAIALGSSSNLRFVEYVKNNKPKYMMLDINSSSHIDKASKQLSEWGKELKEAGK